MRQLQLNQRQLAALVGAAVLVSGLLVHDRWAQGRPVQRIALSEVQQPLRLMVQLQGTPLADRPNLGAAAQNRAAGELSAEHALFRAQLAAAGIRYRELGSFTGLFNGISIEVDRHIAGRISGMRGVAATFVTGKTHLPTPELFSSVGMIGSHKLWAGDPDLAIPGVDGSGITVAVIDTGIDYTHPDLGGCFGPGCRVIAGYDFVGDSFNGAAQPMPDEDPMDQNGHGTHVAGIVGARAAGEKGVTGVAPGVSFVALKVFGPTGSTWDDIILQALEKAYDMRVDVVNMSIGSSFQWPQYPTAMAVQRLANRGIVLATSAGNSGDAGPFATGAPAVGAGTMAVASFENEFARRLAFLDPDGKLIGFDQMEFSPPLPTDGQSNELVSAGLGISDSDFLDADGNSRVMGKVALIQRGKISFLEKMQNAKRHGATEVLIYNNAPGIFRGTLQGSGDHLPTAALTMADGVYLRERTESESVRVTWMDRPAVFKSDTAGLISDFSSWGPAPDLSVKPDLMAPGGSITSTFPLEHGGYATLSGTSMTSPHVAGAAALLLQARREMAQAGQALVKSTAVQTLLMNTAVPQTEGSQSTDLYPVHRQGAGMIDVWRAITAKQRVWPEKIALGATAVGATSTRTISVENLGAVPETFRFQAEGAGLSPVQVESSPESLIVRPGRTGRVELRLSVPDGMPGQEIFSGWITVLNSQDKVVARLPYVGFNGDYQAASAFEPLPPYDFPWLARLDGFFIYRSESIVIRPNCQCDAAYAWILFSLARQPQELRLEIWDAQGGRRWGNAFQLTHIGRSAGGIELYIWDGLNDKGRTVAEGVYRMRLLALRPLGNPFNPAHWDLWESGTITVIWD